MRFVTFEQGGVLEPGVLFGDDIIGLAAAGFDSTLDVIRRGADARDGIERWLANPSGRSIHRRSKVRLKAPIPRPPKIVCAGLNYQDHADETGITPSDVPTIFAKLPTAVIGPEDEIVLPAASSKPDYEGELAFVVGRGGRHIAAENWREHVFGYTIFNDVSARDFQMATTQWLIGKSFDTFAPIGPWLVTADEIEDPHALEITTTINGETMQSSNTGRLIFKIPELIEHLSSVFTLEPGDVVATGTSAGVGAARKPPRWLRPGDEVTVRVAGVGALRNVVVAEDLLGNGARGRA